MQYVKSSLLVASVVFSLLAAGKSQAQTTIFNDTFTGSSTLNTANTTPSGNNTGYQIASTKNTTASSLSANDLKMTFASTSSGIAEVQALFTTTPISLVTVGDYITFTATYNNTTGAIFPTATIASGSSFLSGGLYNSGGAAPVASGGLDNAGIGTGTGFATGNAQNWLGYIGRINGLANNSIIATRPAQSTGNNVSQDLIGANFSTSGGYANPVTIHSLASPTLTANTGDSFSYTIKYLLSAAGTLTITDTLIDNTTSTTLFTDSGTATGGTLLTTSFDGLGFGYRTATNNALAVTMDITSFNVTDFIQPAPEPASMTILAMGGLAVLATGRRYFRRRQ